MQFNTYTRKPFVVEALEITDDNLVECAALIGEVEERDGKRSIKINNRLVPNIRRAYAGWWLTKMEDNLRVYSPKIFLDQFEPVSKVQVGEVQNVFQVTLDMIEPDLFPGAGN